MDPDPRAAREKGAPPQTDGLLTGGHLAVSRGLLEMLARSLRVVNSLLRSKLNFQCDMCADRVYFIAINLFF